MENENEDENVIDNKIVDVVKKRKKLFGGWGGSFLHGKRI
jgi:hypothetical protein